MRLCQSVPVSVCLSQAENHPFLCSWGRVFLSRHLEVEELSG